MLEYRNKVDMRTCPTCGKRRPYDWYLRRSPECWLCRETAHAVRKGDLMKPSAARPLRKGGVLGPYQAKERRS